MLASMQAECSVNFLLFAITQIRVSLKTDIRKAPISVLLVQPYSSSGTMLPMLTWATSSSNHKALGRSSGPANNVQTATCTDGQQLSIAGAQAVDVPNAAARKNASTVLWLPKLLRLQLSGTTQQTKVPHLTAW